MNNRIKQLAEQCRCEDWFDYELFAELIMRECADVASGLSAPTVALRIKEHFGVEE